MTLELKSDTLILRPDREDQVKILCTQLPPTEAMLAMPLIGGFIMDFLSKMFAMKDDRDLIKLIPVMTKVTPDTLKKIMNTFFQGVKVQNGDDPLIELTSVNNVNAAFAGRLLDMMTALIFSLKVNYLDFIPDVLEESQTDAEKKKENPST